MEISEGNESDSDIEMDSVSQEAMDVDNMADLPRSESLKVGLGTGVPDNCHTLGVRLFKNSFECCFFTKQQLSSLCITSAKPFVYQCLTFCV